MTPVPPILPTFTPPPTQVADAGALIYIVRPGDTLASIALDFGIPVEVLQGANPDIEPRELQVGGQVIIPPPQTPITPMPRLDAPPPACHLTAADELLCLGLVINEAGYPVEDVRVRVWAYDFDGMPLGSVGSAADRAILPPGEAAPYSARLALDTSRYAQARAEIEAAALAPRADIRFAALTLDSQQVERVGGRYRVVAALHNRDPRPTEPARLILVLLDEGGQVVGFRIGLAETGLGPGDRQTVVIEAAPVGDRPAVDHRLYVEARPLTR